MTRFQGRWEVGKMVGSGGQGTTFEAFSTASESHEKYALKILNPVEGQDSDTLEQKRRRFEGEINAIKQLNHSNIIKLIDFDINDTEPFMVSEFCVGGELTFEKLSSLSLTEKLRLFSDICEAVAYAHAKKIIHRDIKPANILFKEDRSTPIVADFGICFSTEEGLERLTQTIEQVGARYYMAPELSDGRLEEVTPACDVYSLGKLLYWMVKGRLFDREKHKRSQWDLRNEFDENVIHDIYDEIFEKTIVEEPTERFPNAGLLKEAVVKIMQIAENSGRYLDADIPSNCLFCGVGKYIEKTIIPRITELPKDPGRPEISNYSLDYGNHFGLGSGLPDRLPEGNIKQGLYKRFLILKCDHCGNVQFFQFENIENNWKNTLPSLS